MAEPNYGDPMLHTGVYAFDNWGPLTNEPAPIISRNNFGENKNERIPPVVNKQTEQDLTGNASRRDYVQNRGTTSTAALVSTSEQSRKQDNLRYHHGITYTKRNNRVWHGKVHHGGRSFEAGIHSVVDNTCFVLDMKEMPISLTMVRTSVPEEVGPYLENIMLSLVYRVVVFQFTPSDVAALGGYMVLYNELKRNNSYGVIVDTSTSKLPGKVKVFYVVPLAKESRMLLESPYYVKKSFRENRNSDYLIGIAVLKMPQHAFQLRIKPYQKKGNFALDFEYIAWM